MLAAVEAHSLAGAAHAALVRKTLLGDSCNAVGAAAYAKKMRTKK